jgi:hypothetical protein
MSFEIKEIKIKFYTNMENKEQRLIDFDLDMLYNETVSKPNDKGETTAEPLNKSGLNKLPYFTMSVKYPLARLQKDLKSYQERVKFFFDEAEFQKKLFLFTKGPTESEEVDVNNEIAEHNVMTMIEILFPTKFTVINNFHTSMDHVFGKSYFGRMMINPTIKKYYSYLKLSDGKIYTFTRAIWLNDMLNHPLYRTLLKEFHTFWLWHSKEKNKLIKQMTTIINDISKKVDEILIKLVQGIHQSFRYYDLDSDYDHIYLDIDDIALDLLSKIVRFKTVVDKLKSGDVVSLDKILAAAKFDDSKKEKDGYFLDKIKGQIESTNEALKKEEHQKQHLIKFDDEDDTDKDSNYKKVKDYIDIYFTREQVEGKIKLARFIKILTETELVDQTDDYVKKHKEAIKKLVAAKKLSEKDGKTDLPIPQAAKSFLDKIATALKGIYLNPIKVPLQSFDNLQVYVTKPLNEVERVNKTLNTEYATFMRNVRSRYWGAQRKSVNTHLQSLIDANDEKSTIDFFNIFSAIYAIYMLGTKTRMHMDLEEKITFSLNTGITKVNTNVQNWQYEIYIMADFIQGKVDDQNADKIFCPYVGEYLGTLFDFLFTLSLYGKGNEKDKMRWAVDRNRVFFSLDQIKLKNGEMRQELNQKPLNVSLLAQNAENNKTSGFNPNRISNQPNEEAMPQDEERINTLFVQNVISADPAITGEDGILSKLKQYVSDIDESRILSFIAKNNKDMFKIIKRWHDNEYTRSQSLLEEMLRIRPTYQGENAAIQQQLNDPNYILDSSEKIKIRTKAEFNNLYIAILDKLIELEKNKAIDTNVTNLKAITGGTRRIPQKNNYKTRKYRLAKAYV